MATFTIKNIPPALYKKLKEAAAIYCHGLNSEIIVCIEKSFQDRPLTLKGFSIFQVLSLISSCGCLGFELVALAQDLDSRLISVDKKILCG